MTTDTDIEVFIDGACEPKNPGGAMAWSFIVKHKETRVQKRDQHILLFSDSQLLINQMWGTWGINRGAYVPLALDAKKRVLFWWNLTGEWISREENKEADWLCWEELKRSGHIR
ncbi:MAG: reverse transcriptase-like protein [Candidatus Binatia bacterium]|nr:reverse transcriptase-like protein [Candidatus Binatia bacterium]